LGLLREDKALTNRFLRSHAAVESIRKQIGGHATFGEKVSTSMDLPLSRRPIRAMEQQRKRRHQLAVSAQVRNQSQVEFAGATLRFQVRQPLNEELLCIGTEA
jgi:hypothetical protein